MLKENILISFLKKLDQHPFCVRINGKEHQIGKGDPEFTVDFKKPLPLSSLMTSTSLALEIGRAHV